MASKQSEGKHSSQRRYPPELKERAVRMAQDVTAEQGGRQTGVVTRIAGRLGVGASIVRRQALATRRL